VWREICLELENDVQDGKQGLVPIKSVPLIGKSTLEYERQRIKEKKIYIRCFLNSFLSFASGLFETVIIHGVHIQSSMIRRINVTKTIHN
jgi:hypothetical protein